jgi:hypothetical protein
LPVPSSRGRPVACSCAGPQGALPGTYDLVELDEDGTARVLQQGLASGVEDHEIRYEAR